MHRISLGSARGHLAPRLLATIAGLLLLWPAGTAAGAAPPSISGLPGLAAALAAPAARMVKDTDGDGLGDGWERKHGLNPKAKDSDMDGLQDPVEDLDKDNLSNLGEQRYHTNPRRRDTDRDGISDGLEDSDENGVDNRHQQDARRLPPGLHPTLNRAFSDKPIPYLDGCHNGGIEVDLHPCVYGAPRGKKLIVLFGDSHAAQWLPALSRAARKPGWKVVLLSKSSCPAADLTVARSSVFPSCQPWRDKAIAWIRRHKPALVILASARLYTMYDAQRQALGAEAARDAWGQALGRTIGRLPKRTRVMVLADTPRPEVDVPTCLRANVQKINECVTPQHVATSTPWVRAERRVARANGASYVGLNRMVCPYDPCPVVNGDILMWRDDSHITATFSRALSPTVRGLVADALRTKR